MAVGDKSWPFQTTSWSNFGCLVLLATDMATPKLLREKISRALEKYETFILSNNEMVSRTESILRSLLFFMPGRLQNADISYELGTLLRVSVWCSLSLLFNYNKLKLILCLDCCLVTTILFFWERANPFQRTPRLLVKYWIQALTTFRVPNRELLPSAAVLSLFANSELLIELVSSRFVSSKARWRIVCIIECVKLAVNGGAPLIFTAESITNWNCWLQTKAAF